jgi:hypothetical protein
MAIARPWKKWLRPGEWWLRRRMTSVSPQPIVSRQSRCARWLCRRRMLRCLGPPRFTGISSTGDSNRAVGIAAVKTLVGVCCVHRVWIFGQASSCNFIHTAAESIMGPRQLIEAWVEAFNTRDLERIIGFYREDATNHQVPEATDHRPRRYSSNVQARVCARGDGVYSREYL